MYLLWKDFWPANLLGQDEYKDISFMAKCITLFEKTFPFLSLSVTFLMVVPSILFFENRQLGVELLLPSEIKYKTPYYELLLLWEIIAFPHGIWLVLCYDFFFIATMNNVATQFRILSAVIADLGNRAIQPHPSVNDQRQQTVEDNNLMQRCIKHHHLLLQYCEDLNLTCTWVIFCQFFSSVMGICISSVLMTVYPEKRMVMMAYLAIFLLQIFIYCHPGSELKHYSTQVVDGIIQSKWYRSENKIKKALVPMMVRSQRECILSVGYFLELNLKNLINILRMSFSFFTLLNKMLERQQKDDITTN